MGLFRKRREDKAAVSERDRLFGVAYVAYYTPGIFGGDSTFVFLPEKDSFLQTSKATPDQIRRARSDLVDWILLKAVVPTEQAAHLRQVLLDELLEEEFISWLSDVTCNNNVEPPVFDTEGLREKVKGVDAIPRGWDSSDRHSWRLEERRAHAARLSASMIRVTEGPQRASLEQAAASLEKLKQQPLAPRPSGEFCGLTSCPHCEAPSG